MMRRQLIYSLVLTLVLFASMIAQVKQSELPPELRAEDSHIGAALDKAIATAHSGHPEVAAVELQRTLDECNSRKLRRDCALVHGAISSALLALARFEQAQSELQQGLEIAIDLADVALQSEFLQLSANLVAAQGDPQRALTIWSDALEKAKVGKSLYIQAQVHGNRARQELLIGRLGEAESDLRNALQIDEVNGYQLKRLHSVYQAYALLARSDQNLEAALKVLETAQRDAKSAEDWYTGMLATTAIAAIHARMGKVDEAMEELAAASPKTPSPLTRVVELENKGAVLAIAGRLPEATKTWEELHELGLTLGNDLIVFEANTNAASLLAQQNKAQEALTKYKENLTIAVRRGNNAGVVQVLKDLTILIQKHPDLSSIAPLYEQLLTAIADHKDDRSAGSNLSFITLVQLGSEYKRLGEFEKADVAYKSAELLDPDTLTGLADPKQARSLIEFLHINHAVVLGSLHRDLDALIQSFRAFDAANKAGDEKAYSPIVADINTLLTAEDPYSRLQKFVAEKQYWNALRLAEALFFEESWNQDWRSSHVDQSKQTIGNALQALEGMGSLPDSPVLLQNNFYDIPPEFTGLRATVMRKIAQLYLFRDSKPEIAKRFLKLLEASTGPGTDRTVFEARCWLALAEMITGNGEAAVQKSQECSDKASSLDPDARRYAGTIQSYVRLANLVIPDPDSVASTIKLFGDKPELHEQLARAYANNQSFAEAIAESEKAIEMLSALGKYVQAGNDALYCSSIVRWRGSAGHLTMRYVDLARGFFVKGGDSNGLIRADLEESRLRDQNHENSKALEAARKAREAARAKDTADAAPATLWLAQLSSREKPADSIALFKEAIDLAAATGNPPVQIEGLDTLADVLERTGQNAEALAALQQAEDVATTSPGSLDRYSAAMALGWFYRRNGDMQFALAAFRRAQFSADKWPVQQGYALTAQAGLLEMLGDWRGAADKANQAIELFRKHNHTAGIVLAMGELVSVYGDRGSDLQDFAKALQLYESALALDAKAQETIGADAIEVYLQERDYRRAEELGRQELNKCAKDLTCQANARISLADAAIGAGDLALASDDVKAAEVAARHDADIYLRGRLLYIQGRLAFAQNRFEDATKDFRAVCDLITQVQHNTAGPGSQISTNYSYIYDDLLGSLKAEYASGNRGAAWTAVEYAEQQAATSFDLRWRGVFLDRLRTQLDPAERDRERELTSRLAQLRAKLDGAIPRDQNKSISEIKVEFDHVSQQMDDLKKELRTRAPQYGALAFPVAIGPTSLTLDNDEVLLKVHVARSAVYSWVSLAGSNPPELRFYAQAVDRHKLRSLVDEVESAFKRGRPDLLNLETIKAVAQLVLPAEVRQLVGKAKHVIYVPDDCLFLIPLEMLLEDAGKVSNVAITYYPSVRDVVVARTARPGVSSWQKEFLGFADPITAENDPRLLAVRQGSNTKQSASTSMIEAARRGIALDRIPGTAEEVNAISQLFERHNLKSEVHLGSEATKGRVLHTDLTQYRYVHFATHGLLPADSGINEPALVLSRDGKTDDVLLSMSDILGLKLNSDLVVLSACDTGSGALVKGEGVMNLGKAFMSAGSLSVAMTLWQVSDTSTSLLMQSFYKHLLAGDSKAVALNEARQDVYSAGYSNPFFWASFILVGD